MQSTKHNNNHIIFQMRCNQPNIITITSHFQIRVNSDHTLVTMHTIFQSVHVKHNLRVIVNFKGKNDSSISYMSNITFHYFS